MPRSKPRYPQPLDDELADLAVLLSCHVYDLEILLLGEFVLNCPVSDMDSPNREKIVHHLARHEMKLPAIPAFKFEWFEQTRLPF